jgi:hypothetical protein
VTSIEPLAPYVPEEATETTLSLAPRRPISDPVRITLIDNGKPRTVELLRNVVDQLRPPLPVAEVTVYFKGAASRIIDENEAADLARSSDVLTSPRGPCELCRGGGRHRLRPADRSKEAGRRLTTSDPLRPTFRIGTRPTPGR